MANKVDMGGVKMMYLVRGGGGVQGPAASDPFLCSTLCTLSHCSCPGVHLGRCMIERVLLSAGSSEAPDGGACSSRIC